MTIGWGRVLLPSLCGVWMGLPLGCGGVVLSCGVVVE